MKKTIARWWSNFAAALEILRAGMWDETSDKREAE